MPERVNYAGSLVKTNLEAAQREQELGNRRVKERGDDAGHFGFAQRFNENAIIAKYLAQLNTPEFLDDCSSLNTAAGRARILELARQG